MKPRFVLLSMATVLFTAIGSAHGESHGGGSGATGTGIDQLVSSGTIIPAIGILLAAGVLLYLLKETGYLAKLMPGGR